MNVALQSIEKRFGTVRACDAVNLELREGEVVALLGENGAGKSTLMKVLYGVEKADAGHIVIDGQPVTIDSPRVSRALGIGMVFQQFSLVPAFTVEENLLLGAPGVPFFTARRSAVRDTALALLKTVAPHIDPARRVSALAVGEKQLVEIAKVLARGAKFVILDEPSSVLTEVEAGRLWTLLRELAAQGRTVVFVTHKLADVAAAADRVVVMRAGKVVLETTETTNRDALVRATIGKDLDAPAVHTRKAGATRLAVRGASAALGEAHVTGIDLDVAGGEILGVAGVTGNGQELLGRLLAGVVPAGSGTITLDGVDVCAASARVAYIPEQPLLNGLAPELSVLTNLTALDTRRLPFWVDLAPYRAGAAALLERFDVRPRDLERAAGTLSGGNVQKLVAARELGAARALVVACFPTMGLDAAASRMLSDALVALADGGAAVVWISEDLEALFTYADRVAVLHRGTLRGPVPRSTATRAGLGLWMTGEAA